MTRGWTRESEGTWDLPEERHRGDLKDKGKKEIVPQLKCNNPPHIFLLKERDCQSNQVTSKTWSICWSWYQDC